MFSIALFRWFFTDSRILTNGWRKEDCVLISYLPWGWWMSDQIMSYGPILNRWNRFSWRHEMITLLRLWQTGICTGGCYSGPNSREYHEQNNSLRTPSDICLDQFPKLASHSVSSRLGYCGTQELMQRSSSVLESSEVTKSLPNGRVTYGNVRKVP